MPAAITIAVADGSAAVAVNVTGLPDRLAAVAVSVLLPGDDPSVHDPTAAIPWAFVVAEPPSTVPPPPVTAKVTANPGTGIPSGSVTITEGAVATAFPGRAV